MESMESHELEAPQLSVDGDVPGDSPLADLRAQVAAAREKAVEDIPVPRLEQVVVRYKAVPGDLIAKLHKRAQGNKGDYLTANASLLIHACVGVFARRGDELVSIDPDDPDGAGVKDGQVYGDPLTFSSPRLAEILGVESRRAVDVVVALFPLQASIGSVANRVLDLSTGAADDGLDLPGN